MAQIATEIGGKRPPSSKSANSRSSVVAIDESRTIAAATNGRALPNSAVRSLSFDGSIDDLPGPAYMVNNNFELIWWNKNATSSFFMCEHDLPNELGTRNLLKLLLNASVSADKDRLIEILKPHMAAGKKRLSQQALIKVYSNLEASQIELLEGIYAAVEPLSEEPMTHFPSMLLDENGQPAPHDLYICSFREGILFTYSPILLDDDYLLDFLSQRNLVINELLKKRKPYLTDVTVMVADVQNSVKICSELPAEEYFELINNIWQESAPIFKKYYGTYGKHAGDGMVYYFFPQPDCDYKLNAIQCALELQSMMKSITQQWQARKGWFSDIFLNIGINEGQEWFGSYHAGAHVEFTVLGETINYASRISDFARNGSVWATKNMLNQIPPEKRKKISFGITRKTQHDESMFVINTYASIGTLLDHSNQNNLKFKDIEMIPVTEIRDIEALA